MIAHLMLHGFQPYMSTARDAICNPDSNLALVFVDGMNAYPTVYAEAFRGLRHWKAGRWDDFDDRYLQAAIAKLSRLAGLGIHYGHDV